jgi:hypothetical protein
MAMNCISRIAIVLLLFAFVASCAHSPRSYKDSEAIKQIRLEYIRSNPEGQYNDYILKGEVVKGMGFMGVLASWGLPNVRQISEGSLHEYWTYVTEDKAAGMWTMYELMFKDQTLVSWVVDKNIVGEGGIRPDYYKMPVSIGQSTIQGSGNAPIKKK